ncbi:hypothetical protein CVIRNUC_005905 [Coccomyxa viridis]|uniref:ADF-H domain-containing protein n=1 Tax=Coccomyxa viridis TaxID=1274662 RepID=A0AAV1I847_9CHLO|nr:hypothetical protein CVIRNUC_005905 [Coccomyxa viridis]
MELLRTAKAALDEGLIDQGDYDSVKTSFLRAQQIKAGLDAGFIPEAEYSHVKHAFLESLNIGLPSSGGRSARSDAAGPTAPAAVPKAPAAPARPQPSQQAPPPSKNVATSSERATLPAKSSAADSRNEKADAQRPGATSSSKSVAVPAAAAGQNGSAMRLGRTEVPTNIPNMGGRRPKQAQATSMSGISVSDDAVNMFYFLKAKSTYRWATWMINSAGSQVVIADVGDKESSYEDFLSVLPSSDCRYGVYDYQFTNSEGCIFNKLVFYSWAPDAAKIKAKMMYASTKDFFKGFLDGLSVELQASDVADISERDAAEAVRSSTTRQ